jgi:tRNA pseudouridine55 synthase
MQKTRKDFEKGEIILIDKPLKWTSFDVVKKLKYGLDIKKIGHAGTLDPLATGLLVICTGNMTKSIEKIQHQKKEYIFKMKLGHSTPSYDLETDFDDEAPFDHVNEAMCKDVLKLFLGEQIQIPPLYSAVKVGGIRAYEYARKGEQVNLNPKKIYIDELTLLNFNLPEIELKVICSKGTYIRSLARDIANKLNTLAHISSLRRIRIGEFSVDEAVSPQEFLSIYGVKN